ncbi:MAG: hypothetical protein ACF8XB_05980 [Planctomycetota bacterium JB042]
MRSILLAFLLLSPASAAGTYVLTPTTVDPPGPEAAFTPMRKAVLPSGEIGEEPWPVVDWCMWHAEADSTLLLGPGSYEPWNAVANKKSPFRVRVIRGMAEDREQVRLRRNQTGGSSTLGFVHPLYHSHLRLEHLTVEASNNAALLTWENAHIHLGVDAPFCGIHLIDVLIDGGFDHARGEGFDSKWGCLLNRTSDFVARDVEVRGIRREHAFYPHQIEGRHEFVRVTVDGVGRTFLQIANRETENGGARGFGEVVVRDCYVRNAGLADGGAAITVSGHLGRLVVTDTLVECSEQGNALVVWPEYSPPYGKHGTPNGTVVLRGNAFLGGSCVRPLVRLSGAASLVAEGNTFISGLNSIAVDVNPEDGGMAGALFPLGSIVGRGNEIQGKVLVAGEVLLSSKPPGK